MSNATIVTVRAVDDTTSRGQPLGSGSLVTPLHVLLAVPAAEGFPGAARLRVELTAEDGTVQDVGVREVGVRPVAGPDAALVALVLDEPALAPASDVPATAAAPADDRQSLEAAVWEHLTGNRGGTARDLGDATGLRQSHLPGRGDDGENWLSLICRLFRIGCPPTH